MCAKIKLILDTSFNLISTSNSEIPLFNNHFNNNSLSQNVRIYIKILII